MKQNYCNYSEDTLSFILNVVRKLKSPEGKNSMETSPFFQSDSQDEVLNIPYLVLQKRFVSCIYNIVMKVRIVLFYSLLFFLILF